MMCKTAIDEKYRMADQSGCLIIWRGRDEDYRRANAWAQRRYDKGLASIAQVGTQKRHRCELRIPPGVMSEMTKEVLNAALLHASPTDSIDAFTSSGNNDIHGTPGCFGLRCKKLLELLQPELLTGARDE